MAAPGCMQCGECCRKVAFKIQPKEYMMDLLRLHRLVDEGQDWIQLTVWHDCPHLEWDGEVASCNIWGTGKRVDFCRDFLCPKARGLTKTPQLRATLKGVEDAGS